MSYALHPASSTATAMGPTSPTSLVSPASPWSPHSRDAHIRRRPSTQSSLSSQRRPPRLWNEPPRHVPDRQDSPSSIYDEPFLPQRSPSPRLSFESPMWERPIRPLDVSARRSHSPATGNSTFSAQDSFPRRAMTIGAGSIVSPTSPQAQPREARPRQDSSRYTPFEGFEDMSMFAAAMTGLDDGWSCGPPAIDAPEPLSPTILSSRDQQRRRDAWPTSSARDAQPAYDVTSLHPPPLSAHQHASREPSPPLTPQRAPSPAFSFEDQPTSHLEEYPDSNRSFAAAITGMAEADLHGIDDELPNYAQSQLEAASANRRQALLRAAELERRWTASRVKRR